MTWLANVLILIGMYLVGRKYRICFVFSGAGELIWTVTSALSGQWDLAFICGVFCVMCVVNWRKWGGE